MPDEKPDITEVPPPPLLKMKDVAERLQVHPLTVKRWVREGKLKVLRFGARTVRIEPAELYRFMREYREPKRRRKPKATP